MENPHLEKMHNIELEHTRLSGRVASIEGKQKDMCEELKATKEEVLDSIKELYQFMHGIKGGKSALDLAKIFLEVLVAITVLYLAVRK